MILSGLLASLCLQDDSDDSGRGLARPEKPTMWLEDWGLEPCVISWTAGERRLVEVEFNHITIDLI